MLYLQGSRLTTLKTIKIGAYIIYYTQDRILGGRGLGVQPPPEI